MMADFRMRTIHTAVELAIDDNAGTNSGSDRYINESRFISSGSPASFRQSGSIGIIFHRDGNAKDFLQIVYRILTAPVRKEIDITNFAGKWIDRSSRTNSDAGEFHSSIRNSITQHCYRPIQSVL